MAITVGELAALPHLHLTVVAGAEGLDRSISWAHASDLDAPWQYLAEGEMLLANGMGLPDDEDGQLAFVGTLDGRRISALGLGTQAALDRLSHRVIGRMDELDLPLLRIPDDLPFVAIARAVADANQREEHRRLGLTTRVYDLVRQAAAEEDRGGWLAERLASLLGCSLVLVELATGEVLARSEAAGADRVARRARAAVLDSGAEEFALKRFSVGRQDALAVPVPSRSRRALVAHGRRLPAYALLQHAAAALSIELAMRDANADRRREDAERLVAALLTRRVDPGIAVEALGRRGLAGPPYRVTVFRPVDGADLTTWLTDLDAWSARRSWPCVLGVHEGDIVALTAEPHVVMARDEWPATHAAVGVSGAFGSPSGAPDALREATWALEPLERVGVAEYGRGRPLLLSPTRLEAEALIDAVLGPLLTYDKEHASDLVRTLSTFFESERSWQRTADALTVHRQTVVYRMRRVEELTGRSLRDMHGLAELYLAVRAHGHLTGAGALPSD